MTDMIPLICLVVVLVGYRLANRTCHYLYRRWAWIRFTDACVDAMKSEIGLALLPAMTQCLIDFAKAVEAATLSTQEVRE